MAPNLTCANARKIAEKSHVKCYRGSGYCDLPNGDTWVVFKTVWKELFDSGFRGVVTQINEDCANRWASQRSAQFPRPHPQRL